MKKNILLKGFLVLTILSSCNKKNDNIIKAEKVDGKYEGKYTEMNPDGKKVIDGYMINGQKRGIWKYYEDNRLKEVKKFTADTVQYVLDKEDYIYEEKYLEPIKSYVPVPKSWDTNTGFDNKKLLLTTVKDCDNPVGYCPNIVFTYENIEEISFKDFVHNDRKKIVDNLEGIKEIKFGKNEGKYESYQLRYIKKVKGVTTAGLCIWFNFEDKIVIFTSRSEKDDINKYLLLFIEIGNSITKK